MMPPSSSRYALLLVSISFIVGGTRQVNFSTSNFAGAFTSGSGVLLSLRPATALDFDFSPSDVFANRRGHGQYHPGDLTFKYRTAGDSSWSEADTAARRVNVPGQEIAASGLFCSDLGAALPIVALWVECRTHMGP